MSRSPANTDVFAAVADPTRRSLLDHLQKGEQPVKQLAAPFDMSLPAISQHLSVLCKVGLVTQRREGRQRFYRLTPEPLKQISDWVIGYEHFWRDKLASLGEYLEEES
ncbi:transcriptional regulator, ArsR family protein [Synechococcus sp. PCC 7335]|uniref:ArsR/SmtB family transcription factor n=1 Tax=Synechococcus sp. (strain ATCC 29403 / PCC 7335) TaxID=91464 RepID=UPI00017EC0E8|nr:metalloregulator ArsR/SmtB family transcription factor [Synechococcus sp. PCC 7335]EDX82370.1 transcriptional regulator, ArsR family protein [Synechococcus sp. PCC 7335]